ncbi:MAG: glycosyltransferase family 2 protein [Anaerovoracaceae bacterium]
MNKISLIVPCYNEKDSLPLFYQSTKAVMGKMAEIEYEFVFIDDGSTDETLDILKSLSAKDNHCKYIAFSRNFGKEAGMYAGLREAKGDYCVIMDADLQNPPELIPEMYKCVTEEGYQCCGGKRIGRQGDGFIRSILSKSFYKISKALTHMDMSDGYGDFRMMSRTVVNAILEIKEYNRYMKGIFSFVGFETKWLEYHNVERSLGETKWNFGSLFNYALEGILSFSTAPLKIAGLMGCLMLFGGILFIGANWIGTLLSPAEISNSDIILTVILLVSGLQMLFVYVLGAYISKDYLENKRRPVYIVKERG